MHSVREITEECNRLVRLCNEMPDRIDIYYAKAELLKRVEALNSEFSKDSFNEELVARYKTVCNKSAIYMEYVLSRFDTHLRGRYLDRVEVANVFESVDKIIREESSYEFKDEVLLVNLLYKYSIMSELLNRSRDILFSLTEDEREIVNNIKLEVNDITMKRQGDGLYVC